MESLLLNNYSVSLFFIRYASIKIAKRKGMYAKIKDHIIIKFDIDCNIVSMTALCPLHVVVLSRGMLLLQ